MGRFTLACVAYLSVKLSFMPRPAVTPEQRKETRKRIREAAARLVAKRHLQDITVRAVATEAGVSVGTIYMYFENLTELAQSLWLEPVNKLKKEISEDAEKTKDPVDRIRVLLEHYARFANEQHAIFKGAFLYVRPDSMKKPEQVNLEEEVFFCYLRDSIAEGQKGGHIRQGDPAALAQTLWAGIHGAMALPITLDRLSFNPPQDMARHMIDTLMTMIRP